MLGHIRKRGKHSWAIVIELPPDPTTGKRRKHWETIRGAKAEAQTKLRQTLEAVEGGRYIKPSRLRVGEWLEQWCDSYVTMHCSLRTADSYRSEVCRHLIPALGAIPLTQLQPQDLQDYCAHALSQGRIDGSGGLSRRTVQYHHRILSEALSHAVKMGLLGRNVAEAVDPPSPEHKNMAVLAPEDIPKFLQVAKETRHYTLFYTALHTGMRLGELLGLRWCDVDLDLAFLSVVQSRYKRSGVCKMVQPKSLRSRRRIAMTPSLALLLRQYKGDQQAERILLGSPLRDSDLVFSHPAGNPLDRSVVSHRFAKVLQRAGLPHVRFHDLRHTHATLLLKEGVHPKIVSERLGHASIGITIDTYSHVLPGLQEMAAERFDQILEKPLTADDVCKMFASESEPGTRGPLAQRKST